MPANLSAIRLAILEDQPLYRHMLTGLLGTASQFEVLYSAGKISEARAKFKPREIDAAIVDVNLPDGNGIHFGLGLRRVNPRLAIILLSSENNLDLILDLPERENPYWSYLSKDSATSYQTLLRAIQSTVRRHPVFDPEIVKRTEPRPASKVDSLTKRQLDVLKLVSQGLSNQNIADALGISESSVVNHLNRIYATLDIPENQNARVSAVLQFLTESAADA